MPALLESMAWSKKFLEVPWHGEGTPVQGYMSSAEAIEAAGLDWHVDCVPLYAKNDEFHKVEHYKALMRNTDHKVLSVMGKGYKPLQNTEAFEITDTLVRDGEITYATAGSLDGGKRIFLVAKIMSDPLEIVPGDVADKYLLLANSHDGTLAVTCKFVATLVVCQNTLNAALSEKSNAIKVKHTGNMVEKVKDAKNILGLADKRYNTFAAIARKMAQIPMSPKHFDSFAVKLITGESGKPKDDRSAAEERAIDNLNWLFRNGHGQDIEGRAGTVWGAFSAVTERTTHITPTRQERTKYTLMGAGERQVQEAYVMLNNYYKLAA